MCPPQLEPVVASPPPPPPAITTSLDRCRDLAFQKDPAKYRPKPYGEREKPKGAFGDLYPQAVPSTPASRAVKEKG